MSSVQSHVSASSTLSSTPTSTSTSSSIPTLPPLYNKHQNISNVNQLSNIINNSKLTNNTSEQHTPAHAISSSTTSTSSSPPTSDACTRSMFPPLPRDVPICPVSFSFSVSCPIHVVNLSHRGKSTKLAVFNKMLTQHVRDMSSLCSHDDDIISSSSPQTSQIGSSPSTSSDTILKLFDINIIKRIYITQSKQQPTHHVFYIYCIDEESSKHLRNIIHQHTTIKTNNTHVRYIAGKVSIPYDMSTSDFMSHVRHYAPWIQSLFITRILHSHPSSHFRSLAYFYIRVDELHYLSNIPPLPTQHTPITWYKYIPPSVRMCSLCYSCDHVRSSCPHRFNPSIRFCANCGSSSHLAKQCHAHVKCRCCDHDGHNVLECTRYKPSYIPLPLVPNASAFPPLSSTSPSSTPTSPSSTSSSPLSWSYVAQRSALRDKSSPSPPHKRLRHTSFDSDSVSSYNSRDNHSPLSPASQDYLDRSSLARSPSINSISSRSPTPAPSSSRSSSRSPSRSSSHTSSTSNNDDQYIKMLQQTIHQQQQQLEQQQQQITQLHQQLQQLLKLHKHIHGPQQQQNNNTNVMSD